MDFLQDRSTRAARKPWSPKRMLAVGVLTFGLAFGIGSAGTISTMIQPNAVAAQESATSQERSVADVYSARSIRRSSRSPPSSMRRRCSRHRDSRFRVCRAETPAERRTDW